jgi:hypothetical protein
MKHDDQAPDPGSRLRCGDVWGGSCQAWVQSPSYTHDKHPNERRAARSSTCSQLGMLRLVQHPDGWVGKILASNPAITPKVVQQLARHRWAAIRYALVSNPRCTPDVLGHLALDRSKYVRREVATRPDCPPDVLVQLLADAEDMVSRAARANPNLPEEYRVLGRISQQLLGLRSA